jgi:hypothetical protein
LRHFHRPRAGTPARAASPAGTPTATTASNAAPTGDQDGDSSDDTAFDKDDSFVTTFGHAASAADKRTITALIERYYAALASGNGATACSLLFVVLNESIPETYGQTGSDPTAGRGKSCGSVLSNVVRGSHRELVSKDRKLKVVAIRVQRRRAWVLMRFGPESVRRIVVYWEGNAWKVGELLDTELV